MRGQSQIRPGGERGAGQSAPREPPYFGEPGPIVFPAKGIGRTEPEVPLVDEDVDRIALPHRALPAPEPPPEPPVAALAVARSRRPGLWSGLAAGALAGALVGGVVAINLTPVRRPTAVENTPPQTAPADPPMARSVTVAPIAPPATLTDTRPRADPTPETRAAAPETPGLDLDRLAQALAPATPPKAVPPGPAPVAAAPAEPTIPPRPIVTDPPRIIEAPKLTPPPVLAAPPPRPKLPTQRPSFDCAGAASPTQELICTDAALAAADRRLSLAYDAAMASTPDRAGLHEDQQRWLADRDRLGADRAAVASYYQSRITELDAQTREDRRKGGLLRRR